MYDVTNRDSFDSLDNWLNEIKKEIGDPSDVDRVVIVVCANKVCLIVIIF